MCFKNAQRLNEFSTSQEMFGDRTGEFLLSHDFTDWTWADLLFFCNRKVRHWRRLKMKTRVFFGHFSNRLACVNSLSLMLVWIKLAYYIYFFKLFWYSSSIAFQTIAIIAVMASFEGYCCKHCLWRTSLRYHNLKVTPFSFTIACAHRRKAQAICVCSKENVSVSRFLWRQHEHKKQNWQ